LAIVLPRLRDALQYHWEPFAAVAVVRRKIGSAHERLQVRRQPNRHRPATAARRSLHVVHVNAVDIRPLLAILFDWYEPAIHQPGNLFVLERLVLHHVAPVAGPINGRPKKWAL